MKAAQKGFKMAQFPTIFLLIFIIGFYACSHKVYQVQEAQTNLISISDSLSERQDLNQFILPYKNNMANELDRVLTYAPMDLEMKGMNTTLGNVVTDLMLEEGNIIYTKRHPNEKIDMVLMNRGGLRRDFTQGDLSVRSMYELMPFENEAVVVTLTGAKLYDMVGFLRETSRNHPVSGIQLNKNTDDKDFTIGGKPFDENKNYRILTNDYLQKGGDQMTFFLDPIEVEFLEVKLRDMFIDHFEKIDTIQVNTAPRYLD